MATETTTTPIAAGNKREDKLFKSHAYNSKIKHFRHSQEHDHEEEEEGDHVQQHEGNLYSRRYLANEVEETLTSPGGIRRPHHQQHQQPNDVQVFPMLATNTYSSNNNSHVPIKSRTIIDTDNEVFASKVVEKTSTNIDKSATLLSISNTNNNTDLTDTRIKPNGGVQKVDYLLFDAPSWMKQTKVKSTQEKANPSQIRTGSSSSPPPGQPQPPPPQLPLSLPPLISSSSKLTDEKREFFPEKMPNINKETMNSKAMIANSWTSQSSNVITAKASPAIRSTSPRTNQSPRFVRSASERFPEINSKINRSSGTRKFEDIYLENESNNDVLKKNTHSTNISIGHHTGEDYTIEVPQKVAAYSAITTKTIFPDIEKFNHTNTTTTNLPSKFNEPLHQVAKPTSDLFLEKESSWIKRKNDELMNNEIKIDNSPLTKPLKQPVQVRVSSGPLASAGPIYSEQPSFSSRMIHSSPCSPTLERNVTIKRTHQHQHADEDGYLRQHSRQTGLPPRPLRSPIMRISGRSASPVINRNSLKTQSSGQFGNGTTTSTRIDPITGELQHVTTRTRSYTDLNQNATVDEVEEHICGEGNTEVRVVRRKTRRIKPNANRESRSNDSAIFHQDSRIRQRTEETKTEQRAEEEMHYQFPVTKVQPHRTASQTNISGPASVTKTAWLSETNLRNSSMCKQPPMYSTYSAHKENLRRMQEQRRTAEDWQTSNRQLHDSRSVGSRAVLEEMETITLQPIGRGVHDLEPPAGSIARSVRANTPTGRSSSYIVPISRPHSSAARIHPVSAERTKQSSYKEYYSSPIRLKRSTIDLPYSSTVTQALISPPTSRRYVDFICASQTTTHVSSMNRGLQHQHPPVPLPPPHTNNITHLINKWNSNSNNSQKNSTGGLNLPKVNTNSYARQTLTQNIQEITQKQQNRQHSPNQHHRISMDHNELANRSYAPGGWDHQDGFRTIATTNYHRELHASGPQSPYLGAFGPNSHYEATPVGSRSVVQQSENNWKTTTAFSPAGSLSGTNVVVDGVDGDVAGMRQVVDTSKYWYLPGISRPDVIALLRDKEPGSFVIRNSNTYADSFGLALKIPPSSPRGLPNKDDNQSEWVRHFLIGTVPMHDGRGNGVHLRGFSSDPTFPSLAAFVHYHLNRQGALPCTLRLPTVTNHSVFNQQRTTVNDHGTYSSETPLPTAVPSSTMTMDMLYLGSVEVDRLENMNAASRGIGKILSLAESYSDGLPKQCEVQIKVIPHEGVTFMEKSRRSLWKKVIKPSNLLWCGMDPENREFNDVELRSKGMYGSKLFAIVARKQRFWLHENVVYVFCEVNHNQSAAQLTRYVNSVFPCVRD